MTSIDANGYPIGFKCAAGERLSPLATGAPGNDVVTAEVRHVGHHQKEAVVEQGRGGPVWRLASDEGLHLKGTDLAPFPLGYFNAGLQADLAGRIARLARAGGVAIDRLAMGLVTSYSLTGSFVQGTGVGVAEGVTIDLDIGSTADASAIAGLVRDAVAASPALAMVTAPLEITSEGRGDASPCDTHLFLNGQTDDDTFEMLQRVAANTCYLHQTMLHLPPLTVAVRLNGRTI